ncbi:MAG: SAM-dependent methyltransferase [Acidimicrobiaceae bacterium]|nr:SAM-dependent methyltransferase [Acidimicrobiaceae bacterium]MYL03215.1 SAM-dependent methyltransferase [Acidimicrobiaceae bacterium]
MSFRSEFLDDALAAYIQAHCTAPDEVQQDLIEATAALGDASIMQISPAQGALMTLLTTLLQPRFAVEVGTFTGYSALAVARALPPGGRLLCCDISEEWTAIARDHWERAGVADRIDLRIGPALDTLRSLPPEPAVDLAFIDADKGSYIDYYEELVPRLSARGVILVDNTLWDGHVANPAQTDSTTELLRAFNARVVADERVLVSLLPVGDGVSVITRRAG